MILSAETLSIRFDVANNRWQRVVEIVEEDRTYLQLDNIPAETFENYATHFNCQDPEELVDLVFLNVHTEDLVTPENLQEHRERFAPPAKRGGKSVLERLKGVDKKYHPVFDGDPRQVVADAAADGITRARIKRGEKRGNHNHSARTA